MLDLSIDRGITGPSMKQSARLGSWKIAPEQFICKTWTTEVEKQSLWKELKERADAKWCWMPSFMLCWNMFNQRFLHRSSLSWSHGQYTHPLSESIQPLPFIFNLRPRKDSNLRLCRKAYTYASFHGFTVNMYRNIHYIHIIHHF